VILRKKAVLSQYVCNQGGTIGEPINEQNNKRDQKHMGIYLLKEHKVKWLLLLLFIVTIVTAYCSNLGQHLSLESIHTHKETLFDYKATYPISFAASFILVYITSTALSLPFGTVLALLGGFLFGPLVGLFHVTLGATIGASIIFMIAKSTFGEALQEKAAPFYKKVSSVFAADGISYLLFLRLVPLVPFWAANILPALLNTPFRTYFWTTFIGIIPGTFVHTYLGASLEEITTLSGLISPNILFALIMLGLLSLTPVIIKKLRERRASHV